MITLKQFFPIWNEKHVEYIQYGANTRNKLMADFCEQQIVEAKKSYYTGKPIMEDEVFDKFEEYLKVLNPDSKVLDKVGS